jgi:hypothetical protein
VVVSKLTCDESAEPVFINVYRTQESFPRNEFCQLM